MRSIGSGHAHRASLGLDVGPSRGPEAASTVNRLVVVVPVRLLRDGLCWVLAQEPAVEIVGAASSWNEAVSVLARTEADMVILDLDVPDPGGAVAGIRRSAPEIRVIGVGITDCASEVVALAEAGLSGYVTRDQSIEALFEVIKSVPRGELMCSRYVAGALLRRLAEMASRGPSDTDVAERLTGREREILALIERGYTNKQISRELSIEVPTVKNHVHSLLEKLEVSRRGQAAAVARRHVRAIM